MSIHLIRTFFSEHFPFGNLYCFSSWVFDINSGINLIAVELIETFGVAPVNTEGLSINFS